MDADDAPLAEVDANLRDIERANRWLGGLTPVVSALAPRCDVATILDVGCGAADVPRAVVEAARRCGRDVRAVCLDRSERLLALARARHASNASMTFISGEAEALPFADRAFDAVTCTLALHHLSPGEAVRVLTEMRRVARRVALVADLRRSVFGYLGAWLLVRTFTRNRLTRYDAPLSVRRAYTCDEVLALARAAGWPAPAVRRTPFFRLLLREG
jgi:SAM-dependent methyltransferase